MKVVKSCLPPSSVLIQNAVSYDYIDSFEDAYFDKNNCISIQQIGKAFFTSGPKWVGKLFTLRDKIVRLIGLKTLDENVDREALLNQFNCEPGERLGLFKVLARTENEVVFGEDDKHLNFRVSLFKAGSSEDVGKKNLIISTTVVFNNAFGRFYFRVIRPFHKLIVPTMLKGITREIERKDNQGLLGRK